MTRWCTSTFDAQVIDVSKICSGARHFVARLTEERNCTLRWALKSIKLNEQQGSLQSEAPPLCQEGDDLIHPRGKGRASPWAVDRSVRRFFIVQVNKLEFMISVISSHFRPFDREPDSREIKGHHVLSNENRTFAERPSWFIFPKFRNEMKCFESESD